MKTMIAILLLSASCSQAGIVRFTAKHAYPGTKCTAKGAVKTGKLAVKILF